VPWYRLSGDGNAAGGPGGEIAGPPGQGAGYRFVAAPLGGSRRSARGGMCWVATVPGAARPEPPASQLALLRRWFAGWPAPVGELLAATEPADLVQQDVRELRPLPRGYGFPVGTGGVVLLGDAAHAMPHHLDRGTCLGLEDAATLRSTMAEAAPGPRLLAAVAAYDEVRRPRTARVVRQARRGEVAGQSLGRLARLIRRA